MPKSMIKATYTAEGIKGLKEDTASGRQKSIAAACEAMGGKLDALHYALGDDDVFATVDLPSCVHAASFGAAASASGLVETRTVSLLTVAEMDEAAAEEQRRGGAAMAILSPVVEVEGEEATIEAGHLAAKLGLSVDRLRAEMRRGIVYGVVERGIGEDAGRLRLTFRHRARSWTVVVEADGRLNEAPALGR